MSKITNNEILKIGIQYQNSRNLVENSPLFDEFRKAKAELEEAYSKLLSSFPQFSTSLNQEILRQCLKLKQSPEVSAFLAKAEKLKTVSKKIADYQDFQTFRVNRAKFQRAAKELRIT